MTWRWCPYSDLRRCNRFAMELDYPSSHRFQTYSKVPFVSLASIKAVLKLKGNLIESTSYPSWPAGLLKSPARINKVCLLGWVAQCVAIKLKTFVPPQHGRWQQQSFAIYTLYGQQLMTSIVRWIIHIGYQNPPQGLTRKNGHTPAGGDHSQYGL